MIGGLRELSNILMPEHSDGISSLAAQICGHKIGEKPLLQLLEDGQHHDRFKAFAEELEQANPHSLYHVSIPRGEGDVVNSADDHKVEAVMTQRTFTSIRIETISLISKSSMMKSTNRWQVHLPNRLKCRRAFW